MSSAQKRQNIYDSFGTKDQLITEEDLKNDKQDEQTWYGSKKYSIVDHVIDYNINKEEIEIDALSFNEQITLNAENQCKPYQNIRELDKQGLYEGPKKYLAQKDAPLEVPFDVIRKFFLTVDTSGDYLLQIDEIISFVNLYDIRYVTPQNIIDMYHHATLGRKITQEKDKTAPLTMEEVSYAVRGRQSYNSKTQDWTIKYKPYRKYWIRLLLAITDNIFIP